MNHVHSPTVNHRDQKPRVNLKRLPCTYGPWNAALAYSQVWTDTNDATLEDRDVQQFQISAGYAFDFGLDIDVGYKFNEDEEVESHAVGVIFHYAFGVAIP